MERSFVESLFGLDECDVMLTGASSGIGEHWAWTLCKAGARSVALCARRTDKLEKLAGELKKSFPKCRVAAITLDISLDAPNIARAVDAAERALGGVTLNVLINNAGVGPAAPVLKETQAQIDSTLAINVRGPYLLSLEIARRLVAKNLQGSIINVASIYGIRVGLNNATYATSKAALIQLTRAMAIELLGKGIRVNAIAPGYYRSEMTASFYDSPPGQKYLQTKVPSKRLGLLWELDGALLLLASKASNNMQGSVIIVDGGHHISSL
jgi:NAD(P)-dependent dehydrogenase (short-subunit alcohol dehydrogenase family)